MATKKVTITIDDAELGRIRRLVEEQRATSVSGFVQQAVRAVLDDEAAWSLTLDQALAETGGPITNDEKAWADEVLGTAKSHDASVP